MNSTMVVVGRGPKVAGLTQLVLMTIEKVVHVHLGSEVMESSHVKILMSAKRKQPVNAQVANAKTPGGVMSANAAVVCSTHEKMTRVLVNILVQ